MEIDIKYEINEVNVARSSRTNYFIKVTVYEHGESVGPFWQTPDMIKANIITFKKST